jgi:hypothetical protein
MRVVLADARRPIGMRLQVHNVVPFEVASAHSSAPAKLETRLDESALHPLNLCPLIGPFGTTMRTFPGDRRHLWLGLIFRRRSLAKDGTAMAFAAFDEKVPFIRFGHNHVPQ